MSPLKDNRTEGMGSLESSLWCMCTEIWLSFWQVKEWGATCFKWYPDYKYKQETNKSNNVRKQDSNINITDK